MSKFEKEPKQENKGRKTLKRAVLSVLLASAPLEALAITQTEHSKIVKEIDKTNETDRLIEILKELKRDKTTFANDIKNRLYFKIKEIVGNDTEKAKEVIYELVDKEKVLSSENSGLINLLRMVAEGEKNNY